MDTTIQGINNRCQVIKSLKSGGMGEPLLARDGMDRRVAIKRPFASFADGLERFKLEAQAATLDQPNIAKSYETGTQSDGRLYLAMEYVVTLLVFGRRSKHRRGSTVLSILLLLGGAISLAGCGEAFAISSPSATPAGAYYFQATATQADSTLKTAPFEVIVLARD
jgi:serine/threonine protein kinase